MRKRYDPIKGVSRNIGLMSMEGIGYSIPFHIAGNMTGDSAVVATRVATVGSSLAGLPTLTHASTNLLRQMDDLYPKRRRR